MRMVLLEDRYRRCQGFLYAKSMTSGSSAPTADSQMQWRLRSSTQPGEGLGRPFCRSCIIGPPLSLAEMCSPVLLPRALFQLCMAKPRVLMGSCGIQQVGCEGTLVQRLHLDQAKVGATDSSVGRMRLAKWSTNSVSSCIMTRSLNKAESVTVLQDRNDGLASEQANALSCRPQASTASLCRLCAGI